MGINIFKNSLKITARNVLKKEKGNKKYNFQYDFYCFSCGIGESKSIADNTRRLKLCLHFFWLQDTIDLGIC